MAKHRLTASRLQLADHCKYWLELDWQDEPGEAAIEGTRRHKTIETHLRGEQPDCEDEWFAIWKKHAQKLPEGEWLIEQAFAFTNDSGVVMLSSDGHRDYSRAPAGSLTGTADLVIVMPDRVVIIDWKSGHGSGNPAESLQLGFGAYCACKTAGKREASVSYRYLGDKRVTVRQADLDTSALVTIRDRLTRIMQMDTTPRVGDHCGALWCPARAVCPQLCKGIVPRKDSKKENPNMSKMTLASIKKGVIESPICCVVYGPEKVGKSTFAAGAPAPVFLGELDGTAHLDVARFPVPNTWDDLTEAALVLRDEQHEHQTLVVDTADWIEPFVWTQVCKQGGKASIEDFGYGTGYTKALDLWREFLKRLDELRMVKHMNVIMLAHSQVKAFRNPAGDDFDRYEMKLHGKTAALLKEWPSAVLFANYETLTTKDSSGKIRGIGSGARVLHTEHRPAWDAGNRYSLPEELPLDWTAFWEAVKAGKPAAPETLQVECQELISKLSPDMQHKAAGYLTACANDARQLAKLADKLRAMARQATA